MDFGSLDKQIQIVHRRSGIRSVMTVIGKSGLKKEVANNLNSDT